MEEIWRSFNCDYEVSNTGLVKSQRYGRDFIFTPHVYKNKYLGVTLKISGKKKGYLVHRLVFETFNFPIPNGYDVDHKNGDRSDNRLCNLQLLTRRENVQAGYDRKRAAGKTTSKYKNVSRRFSDGNVYWRARCVINGTGYIICTTKYEDEAGRIAADAESGIYPQKFIDRLAKKGIVIGKQE